MAGADRIEGCLFGNGERTGNVCLVTLGLNLFTQGIDPQIDFSRHRRDPPHGRVLQPAAGARAPPVRRRPRLHGVLRLAPGRDQEGLRGAGADAAAAGKTVDEFVWAVPYLPIDPKDVGRTYEAVIRVNSQSGKGGVAYMMKTEHSLDLPRRLQIEFSRWSRRTPTPRAARCRRRDVADLRRRVPRAVDAAAGRVGSPRVHTSSTAVEQTAPHSAVDVRRPGLDADARGHRQRPDRGVRRRAGHVGVDVRVLDYAEHAISAGGDAGRPPTSSARSATRCSGASASTRTSSPRRSRRSSAPSTGPPRPPTSQRLAVPPRSASQPSSAACATEIVVHPGLRSRRRTRGGDGEWRRVQGQ